LRAFAASQAWHFHCVVVSGFVGFNMNTISAAHAQLTYHRPTVAPARIPDRAESAQSASPAQAARTALIDRPDLATKPFGSLVSLFAQGLPLPPIELNPDGAPQDVTGSTEVSGASSPSVGFPAATQSEGA
jgi:hypothetical protein